MGKTSRDDSTMGNQDHRMATRGGIWLFACDWPWLSAVESTSAPWVILVINVNILIVGLIVLSSIFQISSTVEWQGQDDVETLHDNKDKDWQKLKPLHFYLIQDHIESIGKPILLKEDEMLLNEFLAPQCLVICSKTLNYLPTSTYDLNQKSNSAPPILSIQSHRVQLT